MEIAAMSGKYNTKPEILNAIGSQPCGRSR